jgi:hypothetical protein
MVTLPPDEILTFSVASEPPDIVLNTKSNASAALATEVLIDSIVAPISVLLAVAVSVINLIPEPIPIAGVPEVR